MREPEREKTTSLNFQKFEAARTSEKRSKEKD